MEKRLSLELTFKESSRSRIEERGEQRAYEEVWGCPPPLLLNLLHSLEYSLWLRWKPPSSRKMDPLPSSFSYKSPSPSMARESQVDIVFVYTQSMRVMSYRMSQISMCMCGKRLEWLFEREDTHKIALMKGGTCIESSGSQRSFPSLKRESFPQP